MQFATILICAEQNLFFYEQILLDHLKPDYNLSPTACGTRGLRWSDEAKAKIRNRPVYPDRISAGMLRNSTREEREQRARFARSKWTEKSTEAQGKKLTGLKHSEETKTKRAISIAASWLNPKIREKRVSKLRMSNKPGWKHTEAAKAKMRGRTRTDEHRKKLGATQRGNKNRLGADQFGGLRSGTGG